MNSFVSQSGPLSPARETTPEQTAMSPAVISTAPMTPPAASITVREPDRRYTMADGIFALLFWALSTFGIHVIAVLEEGGLGLSMYQLALIVTTLVYHKVSGGTLRWSSVLWAGFLLLFGAGFTFAYSDGLTSFHVLTTIVATLLWSESLWDGKRALFRSLLPVDLIRAMCILPFKSFGRLSVSIVKLLRKDSKTHRVRYALIGLGVALLPTILVANLLQEADVAFSQLMSLLFKDLFSVLWEISWKTALAFPLACYLFGLCYAKAHGDRTVSLTEADQPILLGMRRVPNTIWCVGLTPLCLLYALFFGSQTAYYFSAFSGLLPDGYSYTEYAREGFFQLCTVACINLLILAFLRVTVRRENDKMPLSARLFGSAVSLFTLLLIATAFRKMVLYVERFGLTPLRVYTSVFMVFLAVVFVLLLIALWRKAMSVVRGSAMTVLLLFSLMFFANTDGLIATYNTKMYQNGHLSQVDVEQLYELGESAVPSLVELTEDKDPETARKARLFLELAYKEYEAEDTVWEFRLSLYRARQAMKQHYAAHPHPSEEEITRFLEDEYWYGDYWDEEYNEYGEDYENYDDYEDDENYI